MPEDFYTDTSQKTMSVIPVDVAQRFNGSAFVARYVTVTTKPNWQYTSTSQTDSRTIGAMPYFDYAANKGDWADWRYSFSVTNVEVMGDVAYPGISFIPSDADVLDAYTLPNGCYASVSVHALSNVFIGYAVGAIQRPFSSAACNRVGLFQVRAIQRRERVL